MIAFLELIGAKIAETVEEAGRIMLFFWHAILWTFRPPFRLRNLVKQMEMVGVNSLTVVTITATFTGMVLALQSYTGFRRFGAETLVGTVVALSMTRELGPVLTALMVAGRAGSFMAAELGTMRVTEQIDALGTMAVNPVQFLIVPRILAGIVMLPILTVLADVLGMIGGYVVGVELLGINSATYVRRTFDYLELEDIYNGLIKATFFGLVLSLIGCYKGYHAEGGAEGVGRATTSSVVLACTLILVSDYFLSALLF
ncbi:MAG: ABC transporter permease [candidate division NC10 bacterium]|nr:ABC transporter permease [candidate division NC10 bacterium]